MEHQRSVPLQVRAIWVSALCVSQLVLGLAPTEAAAQTSPPSTDSTWASLRPEAQVSLFRRLYVPPDPDPDVLRWYPLLRYRGPQHSTSFVSGLMASALSRAACGPNRVCRFYLEDAYQREYGLIPDRAGWLGGLLGRALVPELERRGLSLGSSWWPEIQAELEP